MVVGIVGPRYDFAGNVVVNKKTKRKSFKKSGHGPKATFQRPAKYAHLVEGGTVQRGTKAGANRGSVAANSFMERAIESVRPEIIRIFENAVNEALVQF